MRAVLILLVAMGAMMLPSAQASTPITHGPGHRQRAANLSPGVSRPLAVSHARYIYRSLDPATRGGGDPTCSAGVGCGTQVTFTVSPRKPHVKPVVPAVPAVPVTG
jgi:hypothetical protein